MFPVSVMKNQDQFGPFEIHQTRRPDKPLISVVMSAYNSGASVETSVRSILNQSFYDFELIVVDDGSQDVTFQKLQVLAKKDDRIVLIHNPENIGLTKSLIRGIVISRGKYIARQDDDDISAPSRFATQLRYLPKYDFVCCRTQVNQKRISPKMISVLFYRQVLLLKNIFVHGSFLFKRELYDALGGYDTAFTYAQDYDFIVRVVHSSYKIKFLRQVLYFSNKSPRCISRSRLTEQSAFVDQVRRNLRKFGKHRTQKNVDQSR